MLRNAIFLVVGVSQGFRNGRDIKRKIKNELDPVCAHKTSNNEDTFAWIPLEARTLDRARIRPNRLESKVV